MNNLIKIIIFTLFSITIVACGSQDKEKSANKNSQTSKKIRTPAIPTNNKAIIIVNRIRYTLPVRLCNRPRTDRFKGQSITHYSVLAQQGLIGQKKMIYPVFSISGVTGKKGDISNFKLEVKENGLRKTYSGKAPFNIFKGSHLNYKGKAHERNNTVPIEIIVNCE